MMKSFLFGAMAATVLAACSNDDIVDVNKGEKINFRSSIEGVLATRNNVTTVGNLGAFNVTAYHAEGVYFSNQEVKNTGSVWEMTNSWEWPGKNLSFCAYAPKDLANVTIDNNEQKFTGFSPAKKVENQKDVVIAYNTGNQGTVALNFKHVLSQIEVKAKCDRANMDIEVIGVRLVNMGKEADFTFPTVETEHGYTLPESSWSNLTGVNGHATEAYSIVGSVPETLDSLAKSIMFGTDNFMLIPQELTAWNGTVSKDGVYLSVLCRISSNGVQIFPTTPGTYGYSAVPINHDKWEAGKKYVYTLTFCSGTDGGGGQIDPNPEPTDPTDPVDPVDPDKPGGDPILNGSIKFTVTVDDWTLDEKDVPMN